VPGFAARLETRIPPPLLALAAGALMWLAARYAPFAAFALPARMYLALGLGAAGLVLDAAALAAFVRARTTVNPLRPEKSSALVRSGAYRLSRNPMYLGLALLLAGWAIWLANALALALLPAFVAWLDRFQIRPEERALAARFGAEYEAYRARVRRWL